MPAEQRGSPYKVRGGFGVRWIEDGRREHYTPSPPFPTKTAARDWWADEIRPRLRRGSPTERATLAEFVDSYLASLAAIRDPGTVETLRVRLGVSGERSKARKYDRPVERFGDVPLRDLEGLVADIAAWRTTLPEGMRYGVVRAFSQVCNAAIAWRYMVTNPVAESGENPQPKRAELAVFADDAELDRLADEFLPTDVSRALIVFLAETGLRPEEALGLDRRHVDTKAATVAVEQVFVGGRLKPVPKTDRSRRVVPLTRRALAALEPLPTRIDTPAQFPGPKSPRLDLHNWRRRDWEPALESAGFFACARDREHETARVKAGTRRVSRCNICGSERPVFTPYTLRHYFAARALRAGVSVFELARFMGTSVEMIDRTYGHLAPDSLDTVRAKLDAVGGA